MHTFDQLKELVNGLPPGSSERVLGYVLLAILAELYDLQLTRSGG